MEKAINIQTKESHLKTLYIRNSLQEQSSSSQEEGKMFQQPSFLQNMPKNTIQFMATIHRILQCFLETLRFTVAVFPGLASAARKGQQQTPSRAISAGKLPAPKQGSLQAGLRLTARPSPGRPAPRRSGQCHPPQEAGAESDVRASNDQRFHQKSKF